MATVIHKRNGKVIQEPDDWKGLRIKKDFLNRKEDYSLNISEVQFSGKEAIEIRKRALNGLTGGVGIYEGDPYDIEFGEIGNPFYTMKCYLDYADKTTIIGKNKVSVSLKKRFSNDWLNEVADSISFRELYDRKVIRYNDLVKVPYVINYIPDGVQLVLLSTSLFMMTKLLIDEAEKTSDAISDITNASTPLPVVSVPPGVAWDVGDYIKAGLKVTARLISATATIIAIKNLMEDIKEQILPDRRFHLGIRIKTLFEKACKELNMELKSSVLDARKDWVIIPSKGHKGGEKPTGYKGNWIESGVPELGDPFEKFGDLIRVFTQSWNCSYKITGNTFEFERIDHWKKKSNYVIGNYYTDQEKLEDVLNPNTEEIVSNYQLSYAYDNQDLNTLDNQQGRLFQAIVEPKIYENRDLVNIKNLQEINIPMTLGLRKNDLTAVEQAFKKLGKVVDKIAGTNFASSIEARKGSLLLSSHFLTVPKLVVMSGSTLSDNQREILGTEKLWNDLHFINSFVDINGVVNQWNRYSGVKVKFCEKDFIALSDCENCSDEEGNDAMIELFDWLSYENLATLDYRIRKKHTDNLKIKYIKS